MSDKLSNDKLLNEVARLELEISIISIELKDCRLQNHGLIYKLQGIYDRNEIVKENSNNKIMDMKKSIDKLTSEKSRWLRKEKRRNEA
tara:strand:- start:985 stop:1248 length:264 start_codon:yes stop_codon:yes gene_type:complete